MKRYQITLGEQTFEVKVLSDPRQRQVRVEVDGQPLTVEVSLAADAVVAAEEAPAAPAPVAAVPGPAPAVATAAPSNTVTTPLPGVVKAIAVRPGQQVSANDQLVIIEAMKMDNVIRAQRAGTIGTIFVTEGRQVAHGEPLLDYAE